MLEKECQDRFSVLKDVFCPLHNQKIVKVNLNPICNDDDRLYCKECIIYNDSDVYSYEDIVMKLKKYQFNGQGKLFEDLNGLLQILNDQIQMVKVEIQKYHNVIQDYPVKTDLRQQLLLPSKDWNFQDLLNLSKILSEKLKHNNKHKISFKKLNPHPKEYLQKIHQSILAFTKCTIDVAKIMRLANPIFNQQDYRNPIISQNQPFQIQTVKYDLLIQQQIPFSIDSIFLNCYYNQLLVSNDQLIDGFYSINTFEIDLQNQVFIPKQRFLMHKEKICILQPMELYDLMSVDEGRQIIAWDFAQKTKQWTFSRRFDASNLMTRINCIVIGYFNHFLVVGGDSLLVWKLEKKDEQEKLFDLNDQLDQVNCINFNKNNKLLISGSRKGQIQLLYYQDEIWQQVFTFYYNEVRKVQFLSQSDFMCVNKDNQLVIQQYIKEMNEYEYKSQEIQGLDTALILQNAFVIPIMTGEDGSNQLGEKNHYSACGEYLVVVKNNQVKLYVAISLL